MFLPNHIVLFLIIKHEVICLILEYQHQLLIFSEVHEACRRVLGMHLIIRAHYGQSAELAAQNAHLSRCTPALTKCRWRNKTDVREPSVLWKDTWVCVQGRGHGCVSFLRDTRCSSTKQGMCECISAGGGAYTEVTAHVNIWWHGRNRSVFGSFYVCNSPRKETVNFFSQYSESAACVNLF